MPSSLAAALYRSGPVWTQNLMCTLAGLRNDRLRYGPEFERWHDFYARAEAWSRSELLEYQREQLRALIAHCHRSVPFYAERWRAAGVGPGDLREVADLARFPATTKDDLFEAAGRLVSTDVDRRRLIRVTTGGTTGTPLTCWKLPGEMQRHYAVFWQRMRQGVARGERYAAFQGKEIVPERQDRPPYWRENLASNQRLYSMRHLAPARLADYARSLVETPFAYYQGYANFMAVIAEHMEDHGLTPRVPPRAVFSTSDQLRGATRRLFERVWRTRVWDEYGQAEYASLIRECPHGNRHVQMDYGVVEFEPLGSEDGLTLAEMVCTGFIPRAAPLVRYRIGDQVLMDERGSCPCGSPGPLIRVIRGRASEYIVTPDGRRYPTITHFVDQLERVRSTQVVQERPGEIEVRVVPEPGFSDDDERIVARAFEERVGGGIVVRVARVRALERMPNGKVLNIINRMAGERESRYTAARAED